MQVLTELELRQRLKQEPGLREVVLAPGMLITPAARQFLQERRIPVVGAPAAAAPAAAGQWEVLGSAERLAEKPEHYTHLHGRVLVPKTHPRIRLRGKLDSVQSYLIVAQVAALRAADGETAGHVAELLAFVRQVLRAEVKGELLPPLRLLGLDEAQIRAHSHRPQEYLGVDHILPGAELGEVSALLNLCRTEARQAELEANAAFWQAGGPPERPDIIQGLNRLSSAIYILMCRLAARGRAPQGSGSP